MTIREFVTFACRLPAVGVGFGLMFLAAGGIGGYVLGWMPVAAAAWLAKFGLGAICGAVLGVFVGATYAAVAAWWLRR